MTPLNPWLWWLLAGGWPGLACAQLQCLPDQEAQQVFAGAGRPVRVVWQNAGDTTTRAQIYTRLSQTTSATAVPLADRLWKQIEVLPGQTVLDTAAVDFPSVTTESRFLIQWLEGTNRVLGKTEVLVYPTNLLGGLKPMLSGETLGVLDPNDELKPLLRQNGVEFLDLGGMPLEDFRGALAIVGPFQSDTQMREGLVQAIQRIARKGVAVVWIQPPPAAKQPIRPSFYVVQEGSGAVAVVQPGLAANLPENPQSQLNLVFLCEFALQPHPLTLPGLSPQTKIEL